MKRYHKPRGCRRLTVEPLETRRLLTTFGNPWPDPRSLSVSFPSDEAAIGAYHNSLRQVFDQVADRREWQMAVLRAFQTWSVHANINIGLVPDRGDRFGAPGLSMNDPRFGEFRIGAFPQPGVLASATPYQTLAGTWSGDVWLNTQVNYFLGDWAAGAPMVVPEPNAKGPAVELYSVLLHEAGNALGLADNDIPGAVMNGIYGGPNGTLSPSDVAAIRALYGPRTDIYETSNNDEQSQATPLVNPPGYGGADPLRIAGSLNSATDVDFYRFQPLQDQEKVIVRLQAAGISLVKAWLEVRDAQGNKISDAKADSIFQNNLELEIGSLQDHETLFIQVAANADDVFAIGDYELLIDYRAADARPSVVAPAHDLDEVDDEPPLNHVSVDTLFERFGLVDHEVGLNDTLADAVPLETAPGFLPHTRYELISALASGEDRDLWRFQAPSFDSPVVHVHIDPVGVDYLPVEAFLLTAAGDRLATRVMLLADGGLSMEVLQPPAGEELRLFLRARSGAESVAGNYVVTIDFATNAANSLQAVYSGAVTSTTEHVSALTVTKSQLFRFDLVADSAEIGSGVQLSLYNVQTGDIVSSFAAASGATRTEYVWLPAGSYVLRAQGRVQAGTTPGEVRFTLLADVLSDDQGPNPIDPTQPPVLPTYPNFVWSPPNASAAPPLISFVDPLFLNPLTSDIYDAFLIDFYNIYLR